MKNIAKDSFNLETYFLGFLRVENQPPGRFIFLAILVMVAVEWAQRRHPHPLCISFLPRPVRWGIYFALSSVILLWGTFSGGQFIYFQF